MSRQTWIIASILSALAVLGFVGVTSWQLNHNLSLAKRELAQLRTQSEQSQTETAALKAEVAESQARIDELRREKEAVTQAQKNLEQQMRNSLESKDITISELQGKLTVDILDRILFNSGEAELKPEGEKVLQKIATVLAEFPKRQIHVIGHTDNVPIRASSRGRFASNWELSTGRATAAVRYLCEKANVDPRRIGAVGYGEFHPIADNATAEGRAKNRRIALVVLSEELVGSDAAAVQPSAPNMVSQVAAQTNGGAVESTNAPGLSTNSASPAVAASSNNVTTNSIESPEAK